MIRTLAFPILFLMCAQAFAEQHPEISRFCTWKANAARVITMNRDLGLDELELTGHYLAQPSSYEEQNIVLALIEKIYGPYEYVDNDTIYAQTRKTCVRDFYMQPIKEVAISRK